MQTIWTQIRPDILSGLIWIQTACHSDGIPERIFRKKDFENISRRQKCMQNYPVGIELTNILSDIYRQEAILGSIGDLGPLVRITIYTLRDSELPISDNMN